MRPLCVCVRRAAHRGWCTVAANASVRRSRHVRCCSEDLCSYLLAGFHALYMRRLHGGLLPLRAVAQLCEISLRATDYYPGEHHLPEYLPCLVKQRTEASNASNKY